MPQTGGYDSLEQKSSAELDCMAGASLPCLSHVTPQSHGGTV